MTSTQPCNAKVSDVLPEDFEVHEELGKGSNNKALRVTWDGEEVVLRIPRRKSDTQQQGSAKWEYLHTRLASDLGVAPRLRRAWFSRHSEGRWPSGLYMVMDYYPYDLDDLISDPKMRQHVVQRRDILGGRVADCLQKLADHDMIAFDLKASNIVVSFDEDDNLDIRVIDYGRDFCELRSGTTSNEIDVCTPVTDMIDKLTEGDKLLRRHLAFATMMVQLSSTTAQHVYHDRRNSRMGRDERDLVNPFSPTANQLLDSMQGRNVQLLRMVLRSDPLRSVLKHYHGRRNAGTCRTLRWARGEK